ncbi:DoxX family protein [Aquimarina sp. 2201CG5-10]|uniref:DoxX family protein n=1 Tax=Aquimarina callyspongiae TaxID=3098150 RepID=UPI002AB4857A|nr:DoxX family protein [Aquimarina sp. 2201CG5-10]MDY8134478.1 DoxX family protein [Aquimarina sp. 2201CG5-10]
MKTTYINIFLRFSLAIGFLSAVADRFGIWPKENSTWGDWSTFLAYTATINPWIPDYFINTVAILATVAEIIFALFLIVGFKTSLFAQLSGYLLLLFGIAMAITTGIKGPLDYSVFTAAAAAFGLSIITKNSSESGIVK